MDDTQHRHYMDVCEHITPSLIARDKGHTYKSILIYIQLDCVVHHNHSKKIRVWKIANLQLGEQHLWP